MRNILFLQQCRLLCIAFGICMTQVIYAQDNTAAGAETEIKADSLTIREIDLDSVSFWDKKVDSWFRSKKRSINVAGVAMLSGKETVSNPVSDLSNALSGRIPGLFTQQTSGRAGSVYDAASMQVRGLAPVIVVDGIIRDFTAFNFNDVETVTVMKDALSTNLYASQSANGVVYITTRNSSRSKPFEVSFDAQRGFLEDIRTYNFVDAYTYASLYNEAQLNTLPGATPAFSTEQLNAYRDGTNDPYLQPYADYLSAVYKPTSAQSRYFVNFAGKGTTFQYYLSGEYLGQDGNFLTDPDKVYNTNNDYSRYNLRGNGRIQFNQILSVGFNVFAGFENYNEAGQTANLVMERVFFQPRTIHPIYNPDGTFSATPAWTRNAVGSSLSSGYISQSIRRINTDVDLHLDLKDITPGLWAKGVASISNFYNRNINRIVNPPTYDFEVNSDGEFVYQEILAPGYVSADIGIPSILSQFNRNYGSFILGYDKEMEDHGLNVLGTYYYDVLTDSYTELANVTQNAGLAVDYRYKGRYLAEVGLSYSAINRYPSENRWVLLPSMGLGWIVSNEKWFTSAPLSFLKIRGSVGKNASSANSGYFGYIQGYTIATTGYNFGWSASVTSGSIENAIANPELDYERAIKYDLGLELGLFQNKLNLSADYYHNHHYDQLMLPVNGSYSGIIGQTLTNQNLGETTYSGFELDVQFKSKTAGGFHYYFGANFNVANSRIDSRDEGSYPYSWMYSAGGATTQIFGYQALGLVQTEEQASSLPTVAGYTLQPGDIYYQDVNNDGQINQYDQTVIGGDKPLVFYGFNLGFQYKGIDLSVLFQGAYNQEFVLNPLYMSAFVNSVGYVLDYTTENRWTPDNTENATLPRLTLGPNPSNTLTSDFWLRNANYLRLKNVEVGYTLPKALTQKIKTESLRFFVNGQNLLTWTPLEYFDPESRMGYFPNKRIINAGITLKL